MRTKILILGLICFFIFSHCKRQLPTGPDLSNVQSLIQYFTASPSQILFKEVSTLSWSVNSTLTVEINHGIGKVSATGTKEVAPRETTFYTLTAYGETTTRTKTIKLEVIPRAIVTIYRTEWRPNTQDSNNNNVWGCAYYVWLENTGNLMATNILIYARVSDAESHVCDKVYDGAYDLPAGEVSWGGAIIHWPFELGCCESAPTPSEVTWDE